MAKKRSLKDDRADQATQADKADKREEEAGAPASFEEALAETQQIVRDLESGKLTLDESLRSYELGVRRLRQCQDFLDDYERRVELLTGFDKDGNPIAKPFDEEEMTLSEKQQARGRRRGMGQGQSKPNSTDELF